MKRLLCALFLVPSLALADLSYTLKADPAAKSIRVSLTIDQATENQEFRIPAWCPGFYNILNYHQKISGFRATDAQGKELRVESTEPRSWKVDNPKKGSVTVSYSVLGDDEGLGFFRVNVRQNTAFVNGPAAFVFPPDRLKEPTVLKINVPNNWDVATAMRREPDNTYHANDYDEMIDCPIEMGIFERRQFEVSGIPFEAVFVSPDGKYGIDIDRTTTMLMRVSAPAIKMMGGASFKHYTYMFHLAIGDFSGGLEHRSSTVISLPNYNVDYLSNLAAHEFFHAWNVKQIRPAVLGPFDYSKQARTANLWFAEGVTDYYAMIHPYRAEVQDARWLLDRYQDMIKELQNSRVRLQKTVEDTSMQSWENGGFGIGDLSYYTKGALIGFIFDACIRSATDGKKSLDDVMRLLYQKHKMPNLGYAEDGILKAINEVTGSDLTDLYVQMVRSTKDLPYEKLSLMGLRVRQPGKTYPELGYLLSGDTVTWVSDFARTLGLKVGDRIAKILGKPFSESSFAGLPTDKAYDLYVLRDGKSVPLRLKPTVATENAWRLEIDPFADAKAIELRRGWLVR